MNFLNGARWISGVFTGVLNWSPSTARTITLPDDSVTLLGDDRPIGSLNSGVSLRGYEPIVSVTATKTLALADCGTVQNFTNTVAAIVTIPLNSAVPFPVGARIIIRKTTNQTVTIAWTSGVTVLNFLGATLTVTGVTSYNVLRQTSIDNWISYPDLPESAIGGALRTAVDAPTAKSTIGLSNVNNVPLAEVRTSIQVGTNAGISNTAGTYWLAIGNSAGYNATGNQWIAIGSRAGYNATGNQWTAIGFNSGFYCQGNFWTAIGSAAAQSNSNGSYWTAIGVQAGFSSQGQYWTAIGVNAGYDATSGDSNIFIGYNTGRGITTGSGNTILGTSVTGLAATLTNNVILASGNGIKLQIDSTGLATLPISPTYSDNSNLIATTAHVKNVLANSPSIILTVLKWISGVFTGTLNWTPTANRTITLPDDTVTLLGDDRPIGTLNSGVSLRGYEPIVSVTATKTFALSDCGTVQNCINTAAVVITIPLNSSVAYPIGARIIVRKTTSQTVTVAWASGVTVLNSLGATLTVTGITSSMILRQTAIDSWIAFPDLPESTIGGALRVSIDAPTAKSTIGLSSVTNVTLAEPRANTLQIGANSGIANTGGSNWTAIGTNAGLNSTGSSFVAIGTNAGYTNVSGTNWTAIGYYAGYSATGNNWTAVGIGAGLNATGNNWTMLGNNAGLDITSASGNTIIGYNTGRGVTTGSGNTIIGAAVVGLSATLNNNVILASGDGSIKLQIDATGLATLPISPTYSDNSTLVATTAHVKNVLSNSPSLTGSTLSGTSVVSAGATLSVPTVGLGNVSLQSANTTQVARSCRPIVIANRTTAFTFTTTYTDLIFNNTIRDNSSAYNTTTGIFTAPYAGIYAFTCFVSNFAGVSTYTLVGVGSAANTEALRLGLSGTAAGAYQVVAASQLVFMNSGDTRRFGVQVGGTNATGTPEASATTQTSCYMSIEYLGIDT